MYVVYIFYKQKIYSSSSSTPVTPLKYALQKMTFWLVTFTNIIRVVTCYLDHLV